MLKLKTVPGTLGRRFEISIGDDPGEAFVILSDDNVGDDAPGQFLQFQSTDEMARLGLEMAQAAVRWRSLRGV